ncbi:MAG: hypothetical protein KAT34_18890, partial [Candidatus Aminicenantes bacterium]|nr:hypothetical protein [Candidatus Aminicenantes bacterium]
IYLTVITEIRMKKNMSKTILSVIVLIILLVGFVYVNIFAATCTPTNGTVCEGKCCKLTKEGCIAGPCDKIVL